MTHLAILGASGHGKVIADTASLIPYWENISFFDDAWPSHKSLMHWDVVGNTMMLLDSLKLFSGIIIGIGDNKIREKKYKLLLQHAANFTTIIHPHAYVSSRAEIGKGSVIFANAVVNIQAILGESCIVNTGASVDHDCEIGDCVHISPGVHLGGGTKIGDRSWIGIGSATRQEITIGSDVVVGAGSTVVKNIPNNLAVRGTPAKPFILYK